MIISREPSAAPNEASLCQEVFGGLLGALFAATGRLRWVAGSFRVREWLGRRAGAWGESRPRRRQSRSPVALPGPLVPGCGGPAGVGLEVPVDSVADSPLQGPECLFRGLALGDLAVVIGAAVAVGVPDLGDCGHGDGVVETPVPAPGQPVDLAVPGGHLDRRRAVIGGETIPARKAETPAAQPITVAAMTGPTPKISVVVVPDVLTATASFFLVSRIWASRRRRSSRNSPASSQRAWATASAGSAFPRTRVA